MLQISIFLVLCGTVQGAGTVYATLLGGSGQDYATSVTSDPQGNVYVAGLTYSADFPVTPGAVQTRFGGTSDAFVAKLGPDGKLIWATYLGGILDDWATGIALDSAGNVLVTGYTRSANFPIVNAFQRTLNNGASPGSFDAFVAKIDPTGAKLLYSTFLGGARDDGAAGITIDAAGGTYIAVTVQSAAGFPGARNAPDQPGIVVTKLDPQGALVYTFFHLYGAAAGIAVDPAGSAYVTGTFSQGFPSSATQNFGPTGDAQAMIFKVSPDGSRKIYETTLGGSFRADGMAIAVDRAGAVYLAGSTSSPDFPLVRPLQSFLGARPLWKSTDSGVTWTPLEDLPFADLQTLVVDPGTLTTLYAAPRNGGIFKSVDGGVTWNQSDRGIATTGTLTLAIDPLHPQTLYAAYDATGTVVKPAAVYRTVDGASNWTMVDTAPSQVQQLAVGAQNGAQNPNNIYEVSTVMRKSGDSGATWSSVAFPFFGEAIQMVALDPHANGSILASSTVTLGGPFGPPPGPRGHIYRSVNGGADWVQISSLERTSPGLTVDGSTNPSTVYNGLVSRSLDGGVTWSSIGPSPASDPSPSAVAVDPSGTLYAAAYGNGMFTSRERAQSWTPIGSPVPPSNYGTATRVNSIVPAGATGTLYAIVQNTQTSGFVTKLSPDGSTILYSTLLRGHVSMAPVAAHAAQPGVFGMQNWISSIALDAAGNLAVAGGTRASDFPVANAAQSSNAGRADAFAATISADGSQLTYSTYLGGSLDDGALAVATGAQGSIILAGQTWSADFPVQGGVPAPSGQVGHGFVAKLTPPVVPVITSVVNGASFQPGIEAGSWVTIRGANLANHEVASSRLSTALDGVSVTISGKPAFMYYVSPTQINVQAPSDTAVGAVSVVVTNHSAVSAPATAQLQDFAPAFFQYAGTNYAIASRLPDYAPIADPSAVPGTIAAKPGDLVVLWGTGFGATNPTTPAGTVVSGVPVAVTAPTVTIGGVPAQVFNTVLTAGYVGLYQVTVRIPDAAPAGAVAVQASVGGVQTPAGVAIFVAMQ